MPSTVNVAHRLWLWRPHTPEVNLLLQLLNGNPNKLPSKSECLYHSSVQLSDLHKDVRVSLFCTVQGLTQELRTDPCADSKSVPRSALHRLRNNCWGGGNAVGATGQWGPEQNTVLWTRQNRCTHVPQQLLLRAQDLHIKSRRAGTGSWATSPTWETADIASSIEGKVSFL